jgi:triacylglycerol esterase/lipase EstA (alpha/beta hydrolase family)
MIFEVFALAGVMILRLIPVKQKAKGNGCPILLVHGYLNQAAVWLVFKKRLEALGFGPIYAISLGHPFRSLGSYAEKVKKEAEWISKETGRDDLVLIGHSMGGLVSSWYATQLAPKKTVKSVLTLGSPLNGTPMARIALGPNAREMQRNSGFLKQLKEAMDQDKEILFFHIATHCDELVIPGSSALFSENENYLFDDLGHTALLFSQRVVKQSAYFLRDFC